MAKEPTIMQMELNMKVSGLKTSNTEQDMKNGKMELSMKENMWVV